MNDHEAWTVHEGSRDELVRLARDKLIEAVIHDDEQALAEARRLDRQLGRQPRLRVIPGDDPQGC